jgi:hypothetical protein
MIPLKTVLQLAMIAIALAGAFIVANTSNIMRKKASQKLIGAKAFLNDSFLADSWKLIYLVSFLFLIIALMHFNEMLGFFFAQGNYYVVEDIITLTIMGCCVVLQYKWFRLLRPAKSLTSLSEENN